MIACGRQTRREFLEASGSCFAYLSGIFAIAGSTALRRWARPGPNVVAQEAWGRLEEVGPGLWALISTPLTGDYTTLSNGGIVSGRSGVIIVEGTASPAGARWMAERAVALTGRAPTHVVVTHYHGDHSRGVDGFGGDEPPLIHATRATADLVTAGFDAAAEPERARPWADVVVMDPAEPTLIDLGDRAVSVVPYEGHTASDVIIDLPDDDLVWCGDLVWNEMFPNYVDAVPSVLSSSVRSIIDSGRGTFVPGHGPLADADAMSTYVSILDDIERAARAALSEGRTAEAAGEAYRLPDGVGEWILFNPQYFGRAIGAWMREIGSAG